MQETPVKLSTWHIRPDVQVRMHDRRVPRMEVLGPLEYWIDLNDQREPHEQIDANYQHGGGWRDFDQKKWRVTKSGWMMHDERYAPSIQYPGDPTYIPVAYTIWGEKVVCLYLHAWVGVFAYDVERATWILEHLARID